MKKVLMSLLVLVLQLPAFSAARYEQVESKIVEETLSSGFVPTSLKSTATSILKMMGKVDLKSTPYIDAILDKVEKGILRHSKSFFAVGNLASWYFTNQSLISLGCATVFAPYTAALVASTFSAAWLGYNLGLPIYKRLNQFTKDNPFAVTAGFAGVTVASVVSFPVILLGLASAYFYNIEGIADFTNGLSQEWGMPMIQEAMWQIDRAIRLVTDLGVAKTVHEYTSWLPWGFREAVATLAGVTADCVLPKFPGSPYATVCEVAKSWGSYVWSALNSFGC